jgi:hypothetical protein
MNVNVNSTADKGSQLEKDFPNWNNLYNTQNVETMPWYNENLDSDLNEELDRRKFRKVGFLT